MTILKKFVLAGTLATVALASAAPAAADRGYYRGVTGTGTGGNTSGGNTAAGVIAAGIAAGNGAAGDAAAAALAKMNAGV